MTRKVVAVSFALVAVVFSVSFWRLFSQYKTEAAIQELSEDKAVAAIETRLSQTLHPVIDDLLILAESPEIRTLWRRGSGRGRAHASELLHRWARHKRNYYELRVLDSSGMEAVRINQGHGKVVVVPDKDLQDKSTRYFFRESIRLSRGEVFVSPLDLNVDRGKIEMPPHPTLRFCTPVFDEAGLKRGVLIFNYEGNAILEQVHGGEYSRGAVQLINSDGDWLKGRTASEEWGFLLKGRGDAKFSHAFPEAWTRISSAESGQFHATNGLFTFRTLHPFSVANRALAPEGAPKLGAYSWKIVSHVDRSTIRGRKRHLLIRVLAVDVLLLLVLIPGGCVIAMNQVQRAQISHQLQQHGLLLDLADDAVMVTDPAGTITFWNSGSERKYGWTKQEAIGRNAADLLHTELPTSRSEILDILGRDKTWTGELVHTSRAGVRIVSESRWSIQDGNNSGPSNILKINRDITERKKAVESLKKSEESWRRLLATIPLSIFVYDAGTSLILEVNDAAVAVYGYKRPEFLSMKIDDLLRPEQLVKKRGHSARLTYSPLASGEWKQRTKRGRTFDAEITRHPFAFRGRPAVLVLVQDVTFRKQLEAELQHAQKLESIGQLAAGIAHEINTPMQFIGDNVQFSRDGFLQLRALFVAVVGDSLPEAEDHIRNASSGELPAAELRYLLGEIPKALDQALEGTARVSTLVRAMKEFSHPDSKGKSLANLHRAIDNTIAVSRNEWKHVADLRTEYDNSLPAVPCLLGEFNQVILNLLVNAAHAIADVVSETGSKGIITVRTRNLSRWAEIQVEDTGTGIPDSIRNRIFDPFFTTKEVGKGTGQGLAIARSVVVDKHQGTIQFSTQTGKGTTFIVRLPLAPAGAGSE